MSALNCSVPHALRLGFVLVSLGCASDYNLQDLDESTVDAPADRNVDGPTDPREDEGVIVPVEPVDPDGPLDVPGDDDPEVPDADRPVAHCGVEPTVIRPIYDTATWSGHGEDPNGYAIVDYDWALVSTPNGSGVPLAEDGEPAVVFQADLAGVYAAQLVVTNEVGLRSEPCRVSLEAIPGQALWVEMFWTLEQDDMDLHLLAPGGSFGSASDCFFGNCTPEDGGLDWGVAGDVRDDPFLDLDSVHGVGPENINIAEPVDGQYRVVVHDWSESVQHAPNPVTVKIYLDGELVWTDTRAISGEDTVTEFAIVDTTHGAVQPL